MAVVGLVLLVICISRQTPKNWKVNEPLRGELENMVNWEKPIENAYRSIKMVFNVVKSLCIFFC